MKPTETDVKTAIQVLRAYIAGTLETEHCDLLDHLISQCYDILIEETYEDYSEDELLENDLRLSGYYDNLDTP